MWVSGERGNSAPGGILKNSFALRQQHEQLQSHTAKIHCYDPQDNLGLH